MKIRGLTAVIFIFSLSVTLYSTLASATEVEVSVPSKLDGEVKAVSYQHSDLSRSVVEVYNTGSLSYLGRSKAELYKNGEKVFTSWTKGVEMEPGRRLRQPFYWYTNSTGEFNLTITHYFGDLSIKKVESFRKPESNSSVSVFDIHSFRTYDRYVVMDVESFEDADNVVVIPDKFPQGWVFEHAEIGDMVKGEVRTIAIRYLGAGLPVNVDFIVASDSGSKMTRETFLMKVESGPLAWLNRIFDLFRLKFSKK